MTKAQIIEKYIQRIMVDYPEADKIHIDLVQFAEELRQCDIRQKLPSAEDIKRWHQLLVGFGEEKMMNDVQATFA